MILQQIAVFPIMCHQGNIMYFITRNFLAHFHHDIRDNVEDESAHAIGIVSIDTQWATLFVL